MGTPPAEWKIDGHPVVCQRFLPVGRTFERSYHLLLYFDIDEAQKTLTEDDIRDYFESNYGRVKSFSWTADRVAVVEFDKFVSFEPRSLDGSPFFSYDSVDRALMHTLKHRIKAFSVRFEKMLSSVVRLARKKMIELN